jgi:hypothetical protein
VTARLAHQTQKAVGIPNGMRTGTITAVTTGGVTISVSGGTFSAGVGVVTSYAPRVGDTVAVFRQDSSWLILGPTSGVNGWQAMADLGYQNGWVDRGSPFPIGQYRSTASGVQVIGELVISGAPPASGIVSGLPAPAGEAVVLGAMTITTTAWRPRLVVNAAGTFQIFDPPTAGGTLQFCFTYPLDPRLS